jgi:hypothetical protein
MKNWPRKVSESIPAFLWFLHETGRAVGARVLKASGFLALPINATFNLWRAAQNCK